MPRIQRLSLVDQIVGELEAELLHRLAPGDRVIETRVAESYGVSQAPVREALRILEERGFLERDPVTRQTRVRILTEAQVKGTLAVRKLLETHALELARRNCTPDLGVRLRQKLDLLAAAAKADRLEDYHREHLDFHRITWDASGNPVMEETLLRLCAPLWATYAQKMSRQPSRKYSGRPGHEPIVDFIEGSVDIESLEEVWQTHASVVDGETPEGVAKRTA